MTAVLTPPPPPPPAPTPAPRRAAKRGRLQQVIPLLLMLAGVIVLLYPVAATQFNNVKQREFSQQYNQDVQQAAPEDLSVDLAAARAYNTKLEGVPILDPWLLRASGPPSSNAYAQYASLLNRFPVMARVKVPTASIDLPVYHGTLDDVIAKGAGHLYGTSLPVGGPNSHAVLTSHTGMADATLFDHLVNVKEGDLMFIEVSGETIAYQVDQIKIILPNELGDLTKVDGHDYLTLFTCTPYAVNTHRLLVRGERVAFTPEVAQVAEQAAAPLFKMELWMWGMIAGALLGLLALIAIVVRERRAARGRAVDRALDQVLAGEGLGGRPVGGTAGGGTAVGGRPLSDLNAPGGVSRGWSLRGRALGGGSLLDRLLPGRTPTLPPRAATGPAPHHPGTPSRAAGSRPARAEGSRPARAEGSRPARAASEPSPHHPGTPSRAEGSRPARAEGTRPARAASEPSPHHPGTPPRHRA